MKGAVGQVILTARRPRADDKSGQQGEKRVKVQLQDRIVDKNWVGKLAKMLQELHLVDVASMPVHTSHNVYG